MAFGLLGSIGHSEITAAAGIVALYLSKGASLFLSRLALLGQIGFFLELLAAAAAFVLGAIGICRCFCPGSHDICAAHINEQHHPSNDEREAQNEGDPERNVEVTIRLENGFLRTLHKHRCIVTIRRSSGSAQDSGREVWYARDVK